MRKPYIYLSYERADIDFARKLMGLLEKAGFSLWMDEEPNPNEEWWLLIEGQVETCTAFLIVLSPASSQSEWVYQELEFAEEENKPIIPVLREGDPWPRFGNMPLIDMRGRRGSKLPSQLIDLLCEYFDCPRSDGRARRWWHWW